jgi:hypothetical protein
MSAEIAGYCRACGKPLDAANIRSFQGTIYCAEHAPAAPGVSAAAAGFDPSNPYSTPVGGPPPGTRPDLGISPGLAFILGMIPGVGAIYNGQYAKGLTHVVLFGLLISLIENAHSFAPLFGMLIAVFWFYMAFEAYHTAKRRQLGQAVDEFSSLFPSHARGAGTLVAPVVLVVLGVLILMSNLNLVDFEHVMRFWPVGLIVLGGYLLYLRSASKPGDGPGGAS